MYLCNFVRGYSIFKAFYRKSSRQRGKDGGLKGRKKPAARIAAGNVLIRDDELLTWIDDRGTEVVRFHQLADGRIVQQGDFPKRVARFHGINGACFFDGGRFGAFRAHLQLLIRKDDGAFQLVDFLQLRNGKAELHGDVP